MYPQQPQYPAQVSQQYPTMPQYPTAPQQQYPAAYYPQAAAQTPTQPAVAGSLDSFFNQPSTGGGKALVFEAVGTTYVGIVTRSLTNGDIQQQTDTQGRPAFFRDGRPKFVMKVPLQMQPSPAYPDGLAQWFVKGVARDELVRAMAEAGAPEGPPEAGAVIQIAFTGTRPSGAGMNPTKLFRVTYQRPTGAQAAAQPAPSVPAASAVPQQYAQPVVAAVQSPVPVAPAATPVASSDLSPEQQALLAQLTGQTAA